MSWSIRVQRKQRGGEGGPFQAVGATHLGVCSVVLHSRAGFTVVTVSVEGGRRLRGSTVRAEAGSMEEGGRVSLSGRKE